MTLGSGEELFDALKVLVERLSHFQSEIPR